MNRKSEPGNDDREDEYGDWGEIPGTPRTERFRGGFLQSRAAALNAIDDRNAELERAYWANESRLEAEARLGGETCVNDNCMFCAAAGY